MLTAEAVLGLIILVLASIVYGRFKAYDRKRKFADDGIAVRRYLLGPKREYSKRKPNLWIHIPESYNARCWESWGSRSSDSTNQPYLGLTIGSIVARCSDDFNICAITDRSFADLLPSWKVRLDQVGDPVRSKLRELAMVRVLCTHGGLFVPCGFVCYRSLRPAYDTAMLDTGMIVFESNNTCGTDCTDIMPSTAFIGCRIMNKTMDDFGCLLERIASTDFTEASVFEGRTAKWLKRKHGQRALTLMPASCVGVLDENGELVTPIRLMKDAYIPMREDIYGVVIPEKELLQRIEFGWLPQLEPIDAVQADCALGKALLLSLS